MTVVSQVALRAGGTDETLMRRRQSTFLLALAIAGICLIGQLLIWWGAVASAGGLERYVRQFSDYRAVLTGGLMIREGGGARLYDLAAQHEYQRRIVAPYFTLSPETTLPNSHPPLESLGAAPFMTAPYGALYLGWTALELLSFAGALVLLATAAPLPPRARWLIVALACSYHPLHRLLWLGQSTTLVFLGVCICYASWRRGWQATGGLGLAVAALKPQLALALVALYLLERRWRSLGTMIAIWGVLTVALMPLLGVAWPVRYAVFLASSRHWDAANGEHIRLMYNWQGLLAHLVPGKDDGLAASLGALASACTLGVLGWAWWRSRREGGQQLASQATNPNDDRLWAMAIIVSLLTPQHLYAHDLLLLIVPAWLVGSRLAAGQTAMDSLRGWKVLLALGYLLPLLLFFFIDYPLIAIVPGVLYLAFVLIVLAHQVASASCGPEPRHPATGSSRFSDEMARHETDRDQRASHNASRRC